jgi:hypothetical protein
MPRLVDALDGKKTRSEGEDATVKVWGILWCFIWSGMRLLNVGNREKVEGRVGNVRKLFDADFENVRP